jgi:hypothetical protein
MAEAELAIDHEWSEGVGAEPAALGHDRDRAGTQRAGEGTAIGRQSRLDADEAEAVRAADAHTLVRECPQSRGARFPMAAFAETRREHDGRADAARVGFLEHVAGGLSGDRHDETVDGVRKITHRGKAFVAEDVLVARVDGENLAGKAAVPQIGDDIRPASATLGGSHHRDGLGIEQRAHRFHRPCALYDCSHCWKRRCIIGRLSAHHSKLMMCASFSFSG